MAKIDIDKAALKIEKPTAYIKNNFPTGNDSFLIKDPDYDPEAHIILDNLKFCK